MELTDEELIEKTAEILFKNEEIDAWDIYDSLECLFKAERYEMWDKYYKLLRSDEVREKEEEVKSLERQIQQLNDEI
jgi:polyhydroxyalkanoate synthesis regulator phasin